MKSVITMLKRDLRNSINRRMFLLLGFMVLLQAWFILGSGSIDNVVRLRQMHFMAIVFSFNFFGSVVALALNYNSISAERENKVMDLILTSSVSKRSVIISKIFCSIIVSGSFAILYVSMIFSIYLIASKSLSISLLTFRYILPITVFMLIYKLMSNTRHMGI